MHTEALNDIGTALMQLRNAYRKHNIPIPDQLSYSDPVQAFNAKKYFYSIALKGNLNLFRVSQISTDMDTELVGFKLLWI
jgi:hypothetical protein